MAELMEVNHFHTSFQGRKTGPLTALSGPQIFPGCSSGELLLVVSILEKKHEHKRAGERSGASRFIGYGQNEGTYFYHLPIRRGSPAIIPSYP